MTATAILVLLAVSGLACILFPTHVSAYMVGLPGWSQWIGMKFFYGTPSRTRASGFVLVLFSVVPAVV